MKPRRGVSEIVASMIVLMVVSVLGVMLYNISLEGFNGQQNNLLSDVSLEEKITQERFNIVAVSRISEDGIEKIRIFFYNYGQVDVKLTDVYLTKIDGSINHIYTPDKLEKSQYLSDHGGKVVPSDLTYITVPYDTNIVTYKIVSEEGVLNEYSLSQPL